MYLLMITVYEVVEGDRDGANRNFVGVFAANYIAVDTLVRT